MSVLWCLFLFLNELLLFSSFVDGEGCSTSCHGYKSCSECTAAGCGWCTLSPLPTIPQCVPVKGTGMYDNVLCNGTCDGCLRNKYFSDRCVPNGGKCNDFSGTSCEECSKQPACTWCTQSGGCLEAPGGGQYDNSLCNKGEYCLGCLRNKFISDLCPSDKAHCHDFDGTSCSICSSQPSCGWCSSNNLCYDTADGGQYGSKFCNQGDVCDGCLWNHFYGGNCPQNEDHCHKHDDTSCGECTAEPSCGWCTQDKKCYTTTGGGQYNSNLCNKDEFCDGCLWNSYYKDHCVPKEGDCRDFDLTDCTECSSNPSCGWCTSDRKCLDTTGGGQYDSKFCDKGTHCDGCLWNYYYHDHCTKAKNCSQFKNCANCTATGPCAWCTESEQCYAIQGSGQYDNSLCNANELCSGCLINQFYKMMCLSDGRNCRNINNCQECANTGGCGWCTSSRKCFPVQGTGQYNNGLCNKADYCDGTVLNKYRKDQC